MRSLGCLRQIGEKSLWALAFWARLLQSGPGEAFPEPDTRKPAGQDYPQGPGTVGTVAPPSALPLAVGRAPRVQKLPAAAFGDLQRRPPASGRLPGSAPSPGLRCGSDWCFCSLGSLTLSHLELGINAQA